MSMRITHPDGYTELRQAFVDRAFKDLLARIATYYDLGDEERVSKEVELLRETVRGHFPEEVYKRVDD